MIGPERISCVSVDLDSVACYRDIHGLDAQSSSSPDSAYAIGVTRLLALFDELQIPTTLFVIGRDTADPEHRALLRAAAKDGHELASHSWSHDYALRTWPIDAIRDDLSRAHDVICEIQQKDPVGFRAPGYNIDDRLLQVCVEHGYLYDSSVFPCPAYYAAKGAVMAGLNAIGRPSRSSMTRAEALVAPITPYRPQLATDGTFSFWRRGDAPILEIPMAVVPGVRFPVIGTSLHVLGEPGFKAIYPALRGAHRLLNLEFHAIDFMDADDHGVAPLVRHQPDLRIPWKIKKQRYKAILERVRVDYRFATLADATRRFS